MRKATSLQYYYLFYQQSGCMVVCGGVTKIDDKRTSNVYTVWLKVPKLKELCWQLLTQALPDMDQIPQKHLLEIGIPNDLLGRLSWLREICNSKGQKRCVYVKQIMYMGESSQSNAGNLIICLNYIKLKLLLIFYHEMLSHMDYFHNNKGRIVRRFIIPVNVIHQLFLILHSKFYLFSS